MTGDARQFALEIEAELDQMNEDIGEAIALTALYGARGVVQKSPVDTGRFKGNWYASISTPDPTKTQEVDKGGGPTIARAEGALSAYSSVEGFPVIYLQNNLPYASGLEDGRSGQAPGGVLGITIAEMQAFWEGLEL